MDLLFHHAKYPINVLRPRNKHMISLNAHRQVIRLNIVQ